MKCDICGNEMAKYTIEIYKNSMFKESYTLCGKCELRFTAKMENVKK